MTCSKCKLVLSSLDFPDDKRATTGKSSWCKKCHSKASSKWRASQPSEYWQKLASRINNRFTAARRSAKRRGKDFNLTFQEYKELLSDPCYYCENKLGQPAVTGIGLDRVDSSQGYHYDNCVPCCTICNKIKNDFLTLDETLVAVRAILTSRKAM